MRILLAVIDDLFQFAYTGIFSVVSTSLPKLSPPKPLLLTRDTTPPQKNTTAFTVNTPLDVSIEHNGTFYFIGTEFVDFFTDPVVAFDVVRTVISYSEQVRLLKLGGRWAFVRYKDTDGWIFKDALRERATDVFPMFVEGETYTADNTETLKLRLCIHDEFGGGRASLMLTDAEYVSYRLFRKGYALPWTQDRPRTPGTWQKKLRGQRGVHIGIAPKTGSVMEYIVNDVGFIAYVEAVFPDESIKVSGIGLQSEDVYSETLLQKVTWRELRPVFIGPN